MFRFQHPRDVIFSWWETESKSQAKSCTLKTSLQSGSLIFSHTSSAETGHTTVPISRVSDSHPGAGRDIYWTICRTFIEGSNSIQLFQNGKALKFQSVFPFISTFKSGHSFRLQLVATNTCCWKLCVLVSSSVAQEPADLFCDRVRWPIHYALQMVQSVSQLLNSASIKQSSVDKCYEWVWLYSRQSLQIKAGRPWFANSSSIASVSLCKCCGDESLLKCFAAV